MTRTEALELLHEYTKTDSLRKHAYAVETSMRAYAKKFGDDEEKFGITGLLHDFDYEMFPAQEGHPWKGSEILKEKGVSEEIRIVVFPLREQMLHNIPPRSISKILLLSPVMLCNCFLHDGQCSV